VHSNRENVETTLLRIAEKARKDPSCKFTSLLLKPLVNVENVAREIEESAIVEEAIVAGKVEVVGVKYELDSGKVSLLNH
jgi:carbonic anhydrase